jgi:hypothetical protein
MVMMPPRSCSYYYPRYTTIYGRDIANRELHLDSLKENLAIAQNRMKLFADKKRQDYSFSVGDQVLLKLQPYTQSTVASRPYPKLA